MRVKGLRWYTEQKICAIYRPRDQKNGPLLAVQHIHDDGNLNHRNVVLRSRLVRRVYVCGSIVLIFILFLQHSLLRSNALPQCDYGGYITLFSEKVCLKNSSP